MLLLLLLLLLCLLLLGAECFVAAKPCRNTGACRSNCNTAVLLLVLLLLLLLLGASCTVAFQPCRNVDACRSNCNTAGTAAAAAVAASAYVAEPLCSTTGSGASRLPLPGAAGAAAKSTILLPIS
jgi:hypothetical protein